MINQTSFANPVALANIPQGGMIAEIVNWLATVPSGETFPFKIYSIYGNDIDGTVDNFQFVFPVYMEEDSLTGPLVDSSRSTSVNTPIPVDAISGTYDCLTIIGTDDGSLISVMDYKIDSSVLTVEKALGATIVATEFFRV